MQPNFRSAYMVRTHFARLRRPLAVIAALAIVTVAGCRHGRSAMRPIFGRPAIITQGAPCATGDCGGSVVPAEPGFGSSTMVTPAPRILDNTGPESNTPPENEYSPPRNSTPSTIGDEPILEPTTPGADDSTNQRGDIDFESRLRPPLEPPARTGARPTARRSAATTQATLRENVQSYVNDPADLFTPPRADRAWRYIVLHHSAHPTGSFAQIDRDHRERLGTAGCGYHFVVGNGTQSPDGQVEVATRWSDQKAGQHCRDSKLSDINDYGIGVCLIGDFDNAAPSERQIAATRALVAYLQNRYGIPNENVVTHDRAARTATTCPGRNFPADAIVKRDAGFVMRTSTGR